MRVAASAFLGLFLGFVGAMMQTWTPELAGVTVPAGAVLVILASVAVARACAWWAMTRWGAVAFASAWLGATLTMGTETPAGDLVLSSGTRQIGYLILGTMLLSAASGYPLLPEDEQPAPVPAEAAADDA